MLALWQDRYGPNRVGWQGSLQVAADMLKIFFKEDWTPNLPINLSLSWRLRFHCLPL